METVQTDTGTYVRMYGAWACLAHALQCLCDGISYPRPGETKQQAPCLFLVFFKMPTTVVPSGSVPVARRQANPSCKERCSDIEYESIKSSFETLLVLCALLLSFVLATMFTVGREDLEKCDLWWLGVNNHTNARLHIDKHGFWHDKIGTPFNKYPIHAGETAPSYFASHLIIYRSTMSIGAYMGCLLLLTFLFLSLTMSNASYSRAHFAAWWYPGGLFGTIVAVTFFFVGLIQGMRGIDDIVSCNFPGIKSWAPFPGFGPSVIVPHAGEELAASMISWQTYVCAVLGIVIGLHGFYKTKYVDVDTKMETGADVQMKTGLVGDGSMGTLIAAISKQNELIVKLLESIEGQKVATST